MAAFGAHAEQGSFQLLSDETLFERTDRPAQIQPPQFDAGQELDSEAGVFQEPARADAAGRDDHGQCRFKTGVGSLVAVVGDRRARGVDGGVHLRHFHDLEHLPAVGVFGGTAVRAGAGPGGGTVGVDGGEDFRVGAVGAHAPFVDFRVVRPEFDGVDLGCDPLGVEMRSGGEFVQGGGNAAPVVAGHAHEFAGVGVVFGDVDEEVDVVVDEREVGQQPELLQGRDPELVVELFGQASFGGVVGGAGAAVPLLSVVVGGGGSLLFHQLVQ